MCADAFEAERVTTWGGKGILDRFYTYRARQVLWVEQSTGLLSR